MSSILQTRSIPPGQRQIIAVPNGTIAFTLSLRVMMVLMAFLNNIDIARVDRGSDSGITAQSLMKVGLLGIAGVLGAWGWWRSPDTRKLLCTLPGILLIILGFWYFATIPTSIVRKISLVAAITYWAVLLFCVTAVTHVGGRKLMMDIGLGLILYLLGSVALYFVDPELSYFTEVLSDTVQVRRFAGLGHPNVLGRIAVYTALFLVAAALHRTTSWLWVWVSIPFLAAICVASLSRTPVAAGVLAVGIIALPLLKRPFFIYLAGFGLFLGLVAIVGTESLLGTDSVFKELVQSSTKTGSVEEVTTLTGRTDIWKFAWQESLKSPLFGYGAGSSPVKMAGVSGHAHNVLLQPTISIGFPGGILFAAILIWNIYCTCKYHLPMLQMTTIFIVTLGIAETPLFNPLPESVTLMWMVCCFWPLYQQADATRATHYRILPFPPTHSQSNPSMYNKGNGQKG